MVKRCFVVVATALSALVFNFKVWAEVTIPLSEKVAKESEKMGIFEFGQYFLLGVGGLCLLGLGLYALITTGYAAVMSFNEWRKGREEFGEMATKVGVSLVILVLIFVLIGYGYSIIDA